MVNDREYARQYYLAHREEIKAKAAKWRKENPERSKLATREWAKRNPERVTKIRKNWIVKNKTKIILSSRKSAAANREKNRLRAIVRYNKLAKQHNAQTKKYRDENKQASIARSKVNHSLRDGYITKPNSCQKCGIICRVEGHHEDYSKPLDVLWLCRSCHKLIHVGVL